MDRGWKVVVMLLVMFKRKHMKSQRDEVNCIPQSLVITAGTPNQAIQSRNRAEAHSTVEMLVSGMATSHLMEWSTTGMRAPGRRAGG